ncbi:MAG TPA: HAD family phosphatase [Thermoanaerobaculia bacterium]|nr:HAD family phosphatase [Thermoanaerobaculia bacterium]
MPSWFVFDLGNVVVKLAYERVIESVCVLSSVQRDELIRIMEEPGGYRDMERGSVSFRDFHRLLVDRAGYLGTFPEFRKVWANFFDGPVPGIEALLGRAREKYRIGFLSNSNEVHAEVIPEQFGELFVEGDRFIFSHQHHCAKPDPELFRIACQVLGTVPSEIIYTDDLSENVFTARSLGMLAYQFQSASELTVELERDGLLGERQLLAPSC